MAAMSATATAATRCVCISRQVVAVEAYAVPSGEGTPPRGGGAAALQQQWDHSSGTAQWGNEKANEEARRQSAGSVVNKSDGGGGSGGGGGEDFNPAFPGFSPSPTPREMAP
jgi:hypothetical protein